jgi:hypothetical protein
MRDGAVSERYTLARSQKLEKLEGDALDQQPWTLSAKVILFGAA